MQYASTTAPHSLGPFSGHTFESGAIASFTSGEESGAHVSGTSTSARDASASFASGMLAPASKLSPASMKTKVNVSAPHPTSIGIAIMIARFT